MADFIAMFYVGRILCQKSEADVIAISLFIICDR